MGFGELGSQGSTGSMVSWKAARIVDERDRREHDPEREAAERITRARDQLLQRELGGG